MHWHSDRLGNEVGQKHSLRETGRIVCPTPSTFSKVWHVLPFTTSQHFVDCLTAAQPTFTKFHSVGKPLFKNVNLKMMERLQKKWTMKHQKTDQKANRQESQVGAFLMTWTISSAALCPCPALQSSRLSQENEIGHAGRGRGKQWRRWMERESRYSK